MSTDLIQRSTQLELTPQQIEWITGQSPDTSQVSQHAGYGQVPQWFANLWQQVIATHDDFDQLRNACEQVAEVTRFDISNVRKEQEEFRISVRFLYDQMISGQVTAADFTNQRYLDIQRQTASFGTQVWRALTSIVNDNVVRDQGFTRMQQYVEMATHGLSYAMDVSTTQQTNWNTNVESWANSVNAEFQKRAIEAAEKDRAHHAALEEVKRQQAEANAATEARLASQIAENQLATATVLKKAFARHRQGQNVDAQSLLGDVQGDEVSVRMLKALQLEERDTVQATRDTVLTEVQEIEHFGTPPPTRRVTASQRTTMLGALPDTMGDADGSGNGRGPPPRHTSGAPDDFFEDSEDEIMTDPNEVRLSERQKQEAIQQYAEVLRHEQNAKRQEKLKRQQRGERVVHRLVVTKPTMSAPAKFKGSKSENFTSWFAQLEDYFEYSEGVFPTEGNKIIFVGGLLLEKALQWHQDRREDFRSSGDFDSWKLYTHALKERFTDPFEHEDADRQMQYLRYQGDIADYLAKIKELNLKVHLAGVAWRQRIKSALPFALLDRLSRYPTPPQSDEDFLLRVLEVGKTHESFLIESEHHKARGNHHPQEGVPASSPAQRGKHANKGKKRDMASRVSIPASHQASSSGRDSYRDKPREQRRDAAPGPAREVVFTSEEEATRGIPSTLVEKRRRDRVCLRCSLSNHQWRYCLKQANTSSEKPGKVAAAKRKRDVVEEHEHAPGQVLHARKTRKVASLSRVPAAPQPNPAPPVAVAAAYQPLAVFEPERSENEYGAWDEDMVDFS